MTIQSFTSIDKALEAAYLAPGTEILHHLVCRSQTNKNAYIVFEKGNIPPGYTRMTLGEIIPLVEKILIGDAFHGNMKFAGVLGYMGRRKISNSFSCCFGSIRWFFVCLANMFKGRGFQTIAEQALKLEQKCIDDVMTKDPYAYRAAIFQETLKACQYGYRKGEKLIQIDSSHMLQNTEMFGAAAMNPLPSLNPSGKLKTTFTVTPDDTFNVMIKYVRTGHNPVGINMANKDFPGGGVIQGCPAQEEALCRRSNHYLGLITQTYPLPEFGGVYCPGISVFRDDEAHKYAFMDKPEMVNLVAIAAYDLRGNPDTTYETMKADQNFVDGTKLKIRNMLRIMAMKGHETLVLGAFGCGAFQNPPRLMAELFREIFQDPEFEGRFKHVDFAILCQYPKDQANVDAFTEICTHLNP